MKRFRFQRDGVLAIEPRALFTFFGAEPEPRVVEMRGDVAVISVRGPLAHHADPMGWCDSYDEIKTRFESAVASRPRAIVLSIDSPGGVMAGCFETSEEIEALTAAAGVPVYTYVDGEAASAGYRLACIGDEIIVPSTGIVGSIGVVCDRIDVSQAEEAYGIRHTLVTSGRRKADGHPSKPITDDERAALQTIIDESAELFFAAVAERRPITEDEIRALEAGLFIGASAVDVGLADRTGTLDELVASITAGTTRPKNDAAAAAPAEASTMDEKEKEARAALQAVVDGDGDEKAKARARAALAAMDEGDDEPEDDEEETEAESSEDDKPTASAGGGAVSASAAGAVLRQNVSLEARVAELEKERETEKRAALYGAAARPDIAAAVRTVLDGMALADAEAMVGAMKKPRAPKLTDAAATTVVGGTRGAHTPTGAAPTGLTPNPDMDVAMGLKPAGARGIRTEDGVRKLGLLTPAEAKALIAQKQAAGGSK